MTTTQTSPVDTTELDATIAGVFATLLQLDAQTKAIAEERAEQFGILKGYGIKRKDYAFAHRLAYLEDEERAAAITNLLTCCRALNVSLQGELFPVGLKPVACDAPDFGEAEDSYAEMAGPASAKARKRGHRYPKSKFAGAPASAILGAFGADAAAE